MPTTALVVLADGAEEMEAVIAVDVLRRAGLEVLVGGLDGAAEKVCSRGVRLVPDVDAAAVSIASLDCIVLPGGGPGSERLAASAWVGELLAVASAQQVLVAAICAAPTALAAHGVFADRAMTSHPAARAPVEAHCARYLEDTVVEDGNLITSRGPGTAFEFALAIVRRLAGAEKEAEVRAPMVLG